MVPSVFVLTEFDCTCYIPMILPLLDYINPLYKPQVMFHAQLQM